MINDGEYSIQLTTIQPNLGQQMVETINDRTVRMNKWLIWINPTILAIRSLHIEQEQCTFRHIYFNVRLALWDLSPVILTLGFRRAFHGTVLVIQKIACALKLLCTSNSTCFLFRGNQKSVFIKFRLKCTIPFFEQVWNRIWQTYLSVTQVVEPKIWLANEKKFIFLRWWC